MAPPINSSYAQQQFKTDSYTITVSDDIVRFTLAAPATATLPFSRNCSIVSGQNQKIIANGDSGGNDLTIAAGAGDTLIGETTLSAGETAFITGDGVLVWNSIGASGVTGNSGYSGYSAYSGYSGKSGFSGISGFSGFSGISGASGKSGFSGYTGISGFSGYSGTTGYSGYSKA